MIDVISSLSFLGYCLFLRRFMRWPIEALPFFVVSAVVVALYIFAHLGVLLIASHMIFILGGILFLIAPIYLWKDRNQLLSHYFTPGFVIFIAFLIPLGIMAHDLPLSGVDEISRWAMHARIVLLKDRLWDNNDSLLNKDYPPASALLYYFFTKWGEYSDGRFHFAHLFFLLSPLVILLRKYQWSTSWQALVVFSILLNVLIYIFGVALPPAPDILLDRPAGLFFGGMLASFIIMERERALWLYLAMPTMALVLFKPALYPFVFVAGTLILVDYAFIVPETKTTAPLHKFFFSLLCLPFFVTASWQLYIKHLGIPASWTLNHLFVSMNSIRIGHSPFNHHFVQSVMPHYQSSLILPAIFASSMILWSTVNALYATDLSTRNRIIADAVCMVVGFLTYIMLLLLLYLYLMSPTISKDMRSFSRFMVIYYLGWFLMNFSHTLYRVRYPLLTQPFSSQQKYKIAVISLSLFIVYDGAYYYIQHENYSAKKSWYYVHDEIVRIGETIRQAIGQKTRINILWVTSQRDHKIQEMLGYEMFPHPFVLSIDKKDFGTPEQFARYSKQFDYLLLGHVDRNFWTQYGDYFSDPLYPKPIATMALCTDEMTDLINQKGCSLHQMPVYLYNVNVKKGRLRLINTTTSF